MPPSGLNIYISPIRFRLIGTMYIEVIIGLSFMKQCKLKTIASVVLSQ